MINIVCYSDMDIKGLSCVRYFFMLCYVLGEKAVWLSFDVPNQSESKFCCQILI